MAKIVKTGKERFFSFDIESSVSFADLANESYEQLSRQIRGSPRGKKGFLSARNLAYGLTDKTNFEDSLVQWQTISRISDLVAAELSEDVEKAKIESAMLAATFFQVLVSNTPYDEPYKKEDVSYTRTYYVLKDTVKRDRREQQSENASKRQEGKFSEIIPLKPLSELKIDNFEKKTYQTKSPIKHVPDDDYIRGAWRLTYRGVVFGAFECNFENDPLDDREVSCYFSKEDFKKPYDKKSIEKIAKILLERTEKSKRSFSFSTVNSHPRFSMLEYGGYDRSSGSIKKGDWYEHGVKNNHSVQAPKGFARLVEANYNRIITEAGSASKALKDKGFKMSVAKVNSKLVRAMFEQNKVLSLDEYELIQGGYKKAQENSKQGGN